MICTVLVDISVCRKVNKFKIPDIKLEEILANHARVKFNDRLVDIYARGYFSVNH
jgi:hypothetical protein